MRNEPFFITGCPKSGTTLALQLLNNHPNVKLDIELQASVGLIRYFKRIPQQKIIDRLRRDPIAWKDTRNEELFDKGQLREIVRNAFMELHTGWKLNQSWGSNSRSLVFVHEQVIDLFPRAKFFVIIRDPRDVFCSVRASKWDEQEWAQSVEGFVKMFNHYHQTCMSIPARNRIIIRYEDLIQDPFRIYREVGLAVPEEPFKGLGMVYRNRSRPWRPTEVVENKIYNREGRWKADLEEPFAAAIAAGCAEMMEQWNYK